MSFEVRRWFIEWCSGGVGRSHQIRQICPQVPSFLLHCPLRSVCPDRWPVWARAAVLFRLLSGGGPGMGILVWDGTTAQPLLVIKVWPQRPQSVPLLGEWGAGIEMEPLQTMPGGDFCACTVVVSVGSRGHRSVAYDDWAGLVRSGSYTPNEVMGWVLSPGHLAVFTHSCVILTSHNTSLRTSFHIPPETTGTHTITGRDRA